MYSNSLTKGEIPVFCYLTSYQQLAAVWGYGLRIIALLGRVSQFSYFITHNRKMRLVGDFFAMQLLVSGKNLLHKVCLLEPALIVVMSIVNMR